MADAEDGLPFYGDAPAPGDNGEADNDDDDDPYLTVRPAPAPSSADLFTAARLGDTPRLAAILAADPEAVGGRDVWSATPLYYAALCGHLEAVNLLLAAGAVADESCFDGERVHYAALRGDIRAALAAAAARPPPLGPLASDLRELAPPGGGGWLDGLSAPRGCGPGAEADITLTLPDGTALPSHRALLARAPLFRERLASGRWGGPLVALHGTAGRLPGPALRALVAFLYTDRVDCPRASAGALRDAAAAAGLGGLAAAIRRELATQAHYRRLKRGGGGGSGGAPAAAHAAAPPARRFVLHPAALPPGARLAADLGALAARSAALAKAGVDGPANDAADALLLCDGGGGGGGRRAFFRVHAPILAARSPFFQAALAPAWTDAAAEAAAVPAGRLRAVRTALAAPGLAAVLEHAYASSLAAPFGPPGSPAPGPGTVDALLEAGGLALMGPPFAAAVSDGVVRGWAAHPPPLRDLAAVVLAADARGAASLRAAALARLAARFDRAAAGVAAAAAAAVVTHAPPASASCAPQNHDTATLAAFVAAAAPAAWCPAAHAAAAAALAAAAARGEASSHPTPALAAEGPLLADLREAYLEGARGGGGGRRDAVAASFDARLAALGAAAAAAALEGGG